jgi:hypothetical protein
LLDLRRGPWLLAPLGAGEDVGVAVGEGHRGRGLARHLGQRPPRSAEGDEDADRPAAQPEREQFAAGRGDQLPPQGGDPLGVELGTDRERRLQLLAEPLRPGHVKQVAAVDVDHVEGDRDTGDLFGLGDQLARQQRRRHHVEDVDRVERKRAPAAEPAGRKRLADALEGAVGRALVEPGDEALAAREVPVEGRARDAGSGGDVGEAGRRRVLEQALGGIEDALLVAHRVGAALLARLGPLAVHLYLEHTSTPRRVS